MARLSTHVLDTSRGIPARNVRIDLHTLENGERRHLKTVTTNQDGRTDAPILEGASFKAGRYELRFHAGDYHRKCGIPVADPPFLDLIPVRFGIADASRHYHVPLLLSPYGYSTYRGS